MNYEIIDNFLPRSELKKIKNIIFSDDFPWIFKEKRININDTPQKYYNFEHLLYQQNVPNSPLFEDFISLIDKIDCKSLLNMSCEMFVSWDNLVNIKLTPIYPFPNTKGIFYLNNTDGYSIIGEDTKIECIENRLILFDAMIPYHDSNCTNDSRKISISFNYI